MSKASLLEIPGCRRSLNSSQSEHQLRSGLERHIKRPLDCGQKLGLKQSGLPCFFVEEVTLMPYLDGELHAKMLCGKLTLGINQVMVMSETEILYSQRFPTNIIPILIKELKNKHTGSFLRAE